MEPTAPLAEVVAALDGPALYVGKDARVALTNPALDALLGAGLTGRHYITALRQPQVLDAVEQCLQAGRLATARLTRGDASGDVTYDVRCAPVAQGALVTLQDVTGAEQIAHMRRDFVTNVSHELRTPLTAVMGFIETLQGPARDDPAARTRFLEIMARETARMNRLVGDLLSLGRVEAVARQRPTAPVALAELLASVVHTLGAMADHQGAALSLDIRPGAEDTILPGDSDQLRQVFTNLIENGLKYGGQGVAVTVTLHAPEFEQRLRAVGCRVSVSDSGVGFDPVHIPRLTERFYRVDAHRGRDQGGTGLGLAIAKHIINRHRGRLVIESAPDQGSEFTVILPL